MKDHYRWHDGLGFLLPLSMYFGSNATFSHVIYTWLWINCTGSLIFYCIAVNAAHHHPEAIKDGDQPRYDIKKLQVVLRYFSEVNSSLCHSGPSTISMQKITPNCRQGGSKKKSKFQFLVLQHGACWWHKVICMMYFILI